MKAFKDSLFVDKMRKIVPISDNAVAQLADHLEECHFSKRDMILEVGKYCHYAWLIEKGFVRHYWQRDGNDTVTSFSIEGHVVFSMDEFYYQKPSKECAQAMEDIDDFVLDNVQWMTGSQTDGVSRAGQIHFGGTVVLSSKRFLQGIDLFLCLVLQFVDLHTHFLFLFGGYVAEIGHQFVDGSFLT